VNTLTARLVVIEVTLESFARELATLLRLDVGDKFDPEAGLFDDWGLDSLQAFEMIIIVESMAGCLVPPAVIPELLTVGDAYGYYLALVERGPRVEG
jgi:acyl carrier protein